MIVTRLNPSANGPLHLGHVYMAMINEAFAKEGRFIVRWDDSHPTLNRTKGRDGLNRIIDGQRADLDWLGFLPDYYVKQSDIIESVHRKIAEHKTITVFDDSEERSILPTLVGDDHVLVFPLASMFTLEKVIMDHEEGITHLIRGMDLMSEFSLYQYYCRCLGYPQPTHIYLPRLRWKYGDMSKTAGSQSICELRALGLNPQDVRDMVEKACLRYPFNGWTLDNIKGIPCL